MSYDVAHRMGCAMVGQPEVLVRLLEENAKIKKQPAYRALGSAVESEADAWTCNMGLLDVEDNLADVFQGGALAPRH